MLQLVALHAMVSAVAFAAYILSLPFAHATNDGVYEGTFIPGFKGVCTSELGLLILFPKRQWAQAALR